MKKIFVLFSALIFSLTVAAQQTITIKGKVQFTDTSEFVVKLQKFDGFSMQTVVETTVDNNNRYSLTVQANNPGVYILDCGRWQNVRLWVEDENLEVNFRGCDTAKIKIKNPPYVYIKGGAKNELMNLNNYNAYRSYQNMIAISQNFYKEKGIADSVKQRLAMTIFNANYDDYAERTKFLASCYANLGSVVALLPGVRDKAIRDSVMRVVESVNPNYLPLVAYKAELHRKAESEARTAIGAKAPEFSCLTPEGEKIGVASFKGKLLVIDFWASWCGPCRAEIPSMKKIYEEYKDKGVEFLSVSIDSKEDKWREALDAEQMPWPQVLASNSGKELTQSYNFSGVPHIVLIDKDGRFVARGLRGNGVKEAIEKALDK